jgi:hypothetical protein
MINEKFVTEILLFKSKVQNFIRYLEGIGYMALQGSDPVQESRFFCSTFYVFGLMFPIFLAFTFGWINPCHHCVCSRFYPCVKLRGTPDLMKGN